MNYDLEAGMSGQRKERLSKPALTKSCCGSALSSILLATNTCSKLFLLSSKCFSKAPFSGIAIYLEKWSLLYYSRITKPSDLKSFKIFVAVG